MLSFIFKDTVPSIRSRLQAGRLCAGTIGSIVGAPLITRQIARTTKGASSVAGLRLFGNKSRVAADSRSGSRGRSPGFKPKGDAAPSPSDGAFQKTAHVLQAAGGELMTRRRPELLLQIKETAAWMCSDSAAHQLASVHFDVLGRVLSHLGGAYAFSIAQALHLRDEAAAASSSLEDEAGDSPAGAQLLRAIDKVASVLASRASRAEAMGEGEVRGWLRAMASLVNGFSEASLLGTDAPTPPILAAEGNRDAIDASSGTAEGSAGAADASTGAVAKLSLPQAWFEASDGLLQSLAPVPALLAQRLLAPTARMTAQLIMKQKQRPRSIAEVVNMGNVSSDTMPAAASDDENAPRIAAVSAAMALEASANTLAVSLAFARLHKAAKPAAASSDGSGSMPPHALTLPVELQGAALRGVVDEAINCGAALASSVTFDDIAARGGVSARAAPPERPAKKGSKASRGSSRGSSGGAAGGSSLAEATPAPSTAATAASLAANTLSTRMRQLQVAVRSLHMLAWVHPLHPSPAHLALPAGALAVSIARLLTVNVDASGAAAAAAAAANSGAGSCGSSRSAASLPGAAAVDAPPRYSRVCYSALVRALDAPSRVRLVRSVVEVHAALGLSNPALLATLVPLLAEAAAAGAASLAAGAVDADADAKASATALRAQLDLAQDAVLAFRLMSSELMGGFEGGRLPAAFVPWLHSLLVRTRAPDDAPTSAAAANSSSSSGVGAEAASTVASEAAAASRQRHHAALRIATEFLSAACRFGYFPADAPAAAPEEQAGSSTSRFGSNSTPALARAQGGGRLSLAAPASSPAVSASVGATAPRALPVLTAEALSAFVRDVLRSFDRRVEPLVPAWADSVVARASNAPSVTVGSAAGPAASASAQDGPQRPLRQLKSDALQAGALLRQAAEAGIPLELGSAGRTTRLAALLAAMQLRGRKDTAQPVDPAAAAWTIMHCAYGSAAASHSEAIAARQLVSLLRYFHSVMLREMATSALSPPTSTAASTIDRSADRPCTVAAGEVAASAVDASSSPRAAGSRAAADRPLALRLPQWIRPLITHLVAAQEAMYAGKGLPHLPQPGSSPQALVAAPLPTHDRPAPSAFALGVEAVIRQTCAQRGLPQPQRECLVPETGLSLDLGWKLPAIFPGKFPCGLNIAIEIDGPSHFSPRSYAQQAAQLAEFEGVAYSPAAPAAHPQIFLPRRVAEMGVVHASPTVRPASALRGAALRACGWHVLRVSCHDVYVRPLPGAAQDGKEQSQRLGCQQKHHDAEQLRVGEERSAERTGTDLSNGSTAEAEVAGASASAASASSVSMPSWAAWTRPAGGRIVHRVLEEGGLWQRLSDYAAAAAAASATAPASASVSGPATSAASATGPAVA